MKSRAFPFAALASGLALALAAACNTLTGIDQYEKVDCVGACVDAQSEPAIEDVSAEKEAGADVVDAATEDSAEPIQEGGKDVSPPDAPPTTLQRHWAQWPMPDNAGGDAGEAGTWEFEVKGDGGVVHDTRRFLYWQRESIAQEMKYEAALAYCEGLELGGRTWTLPTRIELETLLSPETESMIHPVFEDTGSDFWTASPAGTEAVPGHWFIDFGTGSADTSGDQKVRRVRCVSLQ